MSAPGYLSDRIPRSAPRFLTAAGTPRTAFLGLGAVISAPLIAAIVTISGRRYVPIGDEAAMIFRTRQVGTRSTPLVGVYSTRGWAHPGPILYYLLAVPYRLSGGTPVSVFVAAGLINIMAVFLILGLAYRRRGLPGLLLFAVLLAVLVHGLGPDTLIQIWNPYVPLLLFLAFLLAVWSVAEHDAIGLPLVAVLGSMCVQMHVAYLPLVAGAAIVGAIWVLARGDRPNLSALRRPVTLLAAGLFLLLWLPTLVDQLWGDHNLENVVKYFRQGAQDTMGLSTGLGLVSGHVSWHGAWTGGPESVVLGNVQPEGLVFLVVLLVALVFALVASRWITGGLAFLPILALSELALAVSAAAQVERPALSYLIIWMSPLAAFCWAAVLIPVLDTIGASTLPRAPAKGMLAAVGGALVIVPTVLTFHAATKATLPRQGPAEAVEQVTRELNPQLQPSERVRVEGGYVHGLGDDFTQAWVGVLYDVTGHVRDFYTSDGSAGQKWGPTHRWTGQPVNDTLTITITRPGIHRDPFATCQSQPDQVLLASWDDMTAGERAAHTRLARQVGGGSGSVSGALQARFNALDARSYRLAVFRGPHPCT